MCVYCLLQSTRHALETLLLLSAVAKADELQVLVLYLLFVAHGIFLTEYDYYNYVYFK